MKTSFSQFSCALGLRTLSDALSGYELFMRFRNEAYVERRTLLCGFDVSIEEQVGSFRLRIRHDQEGDAQAVVRFVLHLAAELDLEGLWGFEYSQVSSLRLVETFGGGAHVIDLGARKSIGWTSSQVWLAAALNGDDVDA